MKNYLKRLFTWFSNVVRKVYNNTRLEFILMRGKNTWDKESKNVLFI